MPTDPAHPGQINPPTVSSGTGVRARPGQVILARHAEPALSRKIRLSAREYVEWWARYEVGGILDGQVPPDHLKEAAGGAGIVYTSIRPRAIQTAKVLVGDRDMNHLAVFIEAPLPPPRWPDFVKLSPRIWGVVSRISWWIGGHKGEESRRQAEKRAAEAAKVLHEAALAGQDVLLVAHGFFNTMIGLELRRLGWRCVGGRGYKYWSTRYYRRA